MGEMKNLDAEMERKLHQEESVVASKFDPRSRLYGDARRLLIERIVALREMDDVCEKGGVKFLRYEAIAGRQAKKPKNWLDPAHNWIIEDSGWTDPVTAMLPAIVNVHEQLPLSAPPRTIVEDVLDSYDHELLSAMRDWPLREIEVNRVGAHILTLGLGLDQDQLAALTRRFTVGMMNHAMRRVVGAG